MAVGRDPTRDRQSKSLVRGRQRPHPQEYSSLIRYSPSRRLTTHWVSGRPGGRTGLFGEDDWWGCVVTSLVLLEPNAIGKRRSNDVQSKS